MAELDLIIQNLLCTYSIPFCLIVFGLLVFLTDSGKDLRVWMFKQFILDFEKLHDKLTADIKTALFADIPEIESRVVSLRNKGVIRILELGIGSGKNLKYYPQQCRLVVVDPNVYFKQYFLENKKNKFPDITLEKYVVSPGEHMKAVSSNSVDIVVTTAVLCSVSNVAEVLAEIRRILVPGGKYYFLEHTLDEDNVERQRIQWYLNWTNLWSWFFEGCRFLPLVEYFATSGFANVDFKKFNLEITSGTRHTRTKQITRLALQAISPHIVGIATK